MHKHHTDTNADTRTHAHTETHFASVCIVLNTILKIPHPALGKGIMKW